MIATTCSEKSYIADVESVSYKQALWVGFAQIFSLIPGTSRAGATIIGGLLTGMDRKTSAEFSFLLAIPVMAAVSGYDLLKHYQDLGAYQKRYGSETLCWLIIRLRQLGFTAQEAQAEAERCMRCYYLGMVAV